MDNQEAIKILDNLKPGDYSNPYEKGEAIVMAISALKEQEEKTQLSAEGTTSDLISRQDEIFTLCSECQCRRIPCANYPCGSVKTLLMRLPSTPPEPLVKESRTLVKDLVKEPCEDAVSREAAIDVAENAFVRGLLASPDIRRLPPAQPERKKGKWVDNTYCSECGWVHETDPGFIGSVDGFNFCPRCGADMREDEG